ncbi:PREDICTED: solute carrier family 2, facilitated glucose transporter member 5-like [Thamnophis sirtalis]|uniref:Solute carrier family 2, facilitated glucose transporter member 5-like n=1 Tax=Thamnophis sirtalis TaxID=35019 RepID=A0A6I9Z4D6_9SAUR|nr:PREDICTED: solute carrier family 2, facilitated glucose transporter member 5-like [Thamnophis sirtalis]
MCSISNIVLVFTLQNRTVTAAFITLILTILFFLGYISGPASVLVLIIGELFLQSSRASAYVLAGLISWGINFVSLMLFLLTNSYLGSYYLVLYWPFIILTLIYIFWVIPDTTSKTFEEIQESIEARRGPSRNSRKITAESSFSLQN